MVGGENSVAPWWGMQGSDESIVQDRSSVTTIEGRAGLVVEEHQWQNHVGAGQTCGLLTDLGNKRMEHYWCGSHWGALKSKERRVTFPQPVVEYSEMPPTTTHDLLFWRFSVASLPGELLLQGQFTSCCLYGQLRSRTVWGAKSFQDQEVAGGLVVGWQIG